MSTGQDAILVVVDRLSKMALFLPTKTTITAPETARLFLDNIFKLHGLPKSLASDRDTRFTSNFWQELFKSLGTSLKMSTSFHPETDGQIERKNRTLITGICSYINAIHTNWGTLLTALEFAYNNTIQRSINVSPFFLNYDYNPTIPSTLPISFSVPASHDIFSTFQNNLDAAKTHLLEAQQQQTGSGQ